LAILTAAFGLNLHLRTVAWKFVSIAL